jgi:hypothetical protein
MNCTTEAQEHDISCNFLQHRHIKSSLSLWDTQKQNRAKVGEKKKTQEAKGGKHTGCLRSEDQSPTLADL